MINSRTLSLNIIFVEEKATVYVEESVMKRKVVSKTKVIEQNSIVQYAT